MSGNLIEEVLKHPVEMIRVSQTADASGYVAPSIVDVVAACCVFSDEAVRGRSQPVVFVLVNDLTDYTVEIDPLYRHHE